MNTKFFAQLNNKNICIGIVSVSSEMTMPNDCVEINSYDINYIFKKYDNTNKTWSLEKFEPVSNSPVDRLELVEKRTSDLENLILQGQGVI